MMIKFFTSLFVLSIASSGMLFAQDDAFAKKVLDEVSKKYDSYKTIMSDFTFKATQPEGESYSDGGSISLNKAKQKYRIKLNSQEIISDGKSVWSILPDDKEVQITEADNQSDAIGPHNIFTFYKSGFKYVSMDDEKVNGETMHVIELIPIDTKKNYFKIRIRVNKNKHIHDMMVFDKGGARYVYSIRTLYVNQVIPESTFTFIKSSYSGYEIVDLR